MYWEESSYGHKAAQHFPGMIKDHKKIFSQDNPIISLLMVSPPYRGGAV
jgi:hypothetical protein